MRISIKKLTCIYSKLRIEWFVNNIRAHPRRGCAWKFKNAENLEKSPVFCKNHGIFEKKSINLLVFPTDF